MAELTITLKLYQDRFLFSEKKFPALISAIGTGKTYMFLLKIWSYCKAFPGTTALIVRKEFTDLKDSTMRDFEKYFGVKIGSDKNYDLPNGSKIMFRHADELDVLKNINLGIAGIEQAEEFEDDTQFQFIRDRMRQNNGATVRPICVIANAKGHNWCWKLWVNKAEQIIEIDPSTAQYQYLHGEYDCLSASSFANADNLPADFVADLRRMETEAPKHYAQYVMNSFEEMEEDDFVFTFKELMEAKNRQYAMRDGYGHRIMGYDIARYGNDKCAAAGLHQIGALAWTMFHAEQWEHKDLDYTTGRILSISNQNNANDNIIDEDGIGSGPLDFITKGRKREDFRGFRNKQYSYDENRFYVNPRTAAAFKLKEYVSKGWVGGLTEEAIQELMTLRYKFANDGRRVLVSKDEMRNKYKIKSPNLADALIMAASLINEVKIEQDRKYYPRQSVAPEGDLFGIAGVR
jgi:hypothetical protein